MNGLTGIFLDPPYQEGSQICYDSNDSDYDQEIFKVRDWAIANGDDHTLRIAVCGYEDERLNFPDNWEVITWLPRKGMDKGKEPENNNRFRERIWFSPHCLKTKSYEQLDIFALID
jgi:DNA adenine methylase